MQTRSQSPPCPLASTVYGDVAASDALEDIIGPEPQLPLAEDAKTEQQPSKVPDAAVGPSVLGKRKDMYESPDAASGQCGHKTRTSVVFNSKHEVKSPADSQFWWLHVYDVDTNTTEHIPVRKSDGTFGSNATLRFLLRVKKRATGMRLIYAGITNLEKCVPNTIRTGSLCSDAHCTFRPRAITQSLMTLEQLDKVFTYFVPQYDSGLAERYAWLLQALQNKSEECVG